MTTDKPPQLAEIVALAQQQIAVEAEVARLNGLLVIQMKDLIRIQQEDLPAAMAEAKLKKLTLDSGATIEIKNDFTCGIPADRKEEAYTWLEKNNSGGMIKTHVICEFGKGELEMAKKLLVVLSKKHPDTVLKRDVHWQTLKAWIKERLSAPTPKPVPSDLFGAHPLNKAIIKQLT